MEKHPIDWKNAGSHGSRSFVCGYCGKSIASQLAYHGATPNPNVYAFIYVCHFCTRPTFFDPSGSQTPGAMFGEDVEDIDDTSVKSLYDEARHALGANSFTATVLCCRKLLMHIAVAKGAKEGLSFLNYVQYLADNHYVPPDAKEWVDQIRAKGNEANHQIVIMSRTDAEEIVSFCEMLLKVIFEFPAAIKKKQAKSPPAP